MADGIGGLDFVNNMMAYLAQKWTEDTGGEQPVFTSQWKKKGNWICRWKLSGSNTIIGFGKPKHIQSVTIN